MRETKAEYLQIEKLRPFVGHPFKVVDKPTGRKHPDPRCADPCGGPSYRERRI